MFVKILNSFSSNYVCKIVLLLLCPRITSWRHFLLSDISESILSKDSFCSNTVAIDIAIQTDLSSPSEISKAYQQSFPPRSVKISHNSDFDQSVEFGWLITTSLMKCVRNNLVKKDVRFTIADRTYVASWKYVVQAYNMSDLPSKITDLRSCR